ncbi:hypothetical protein [Halobacterium sp. CBA1126]|uniref:DUF7286 family protein n=1 Tax=Halobacterium sp. CBA1126 TaxID=2668074 RepID=UPI0012F74D33|nr:hypothetical protein [Halobacterium sp. CBA1126]MUV61402.1 hypothetical protein [Halobacterium sp. CBA1126]
MRLAEDDRARVPFALVGVVLLVASVTAAATLAGRSPVPTETRTDRAVERAEASADTALASAARTAAAEAVRHPVVAGANTTFGAAIDRERAFRDALALRVYARTERALRDHVSTAGAASASLSLPRVDTTAAAERAIDRVSMERVGDEAIRVTLSGVRVAVERDGRAVSRSTTNVSATVHSPALALRDRVQRFERLLDRGAFEGPGLDRRLTDYLHRVVWLRGPLQYAGVPISNVLANRHVEVMANRALLDVQRTAFGRADDAGRGAYRRALARVALDDVLAVAKDDAKARANEVLGAPELSQTPRKVGLSSALAAAGSSSQPVPVGVNATADRAFLEFTSGDGETSLDGTLRAAYTSRASRTVDATVVDRSTSQTGKPPENGTLVRVSDDRDVDVEATVEPADALPAGQRAAETAGRRVVVTERETRRYAAGNRSHRVVETTETTYRVSVGVSYALQPPTRALPAERAERVLDVDASTVTPAIHERIAASAERALVDDAGGVDAVARRAVAGDAPDRETLVRPSLSESVRERAYRAAADLRPRARNVSADVSTRGLAGGRVPTDALRERVLALHDARDGYDTATDRAVAAVRETYLARVAGRLGDRRADGALSSIGDALGSRGLEVPPTDHADASADGPVAAVEGAPAYLPLAEVTPETVPESEARYHPLAARNVNWFTIPHGDAASAVVDAAMPDPPAVGPGRHRRAGAVGGERHARGRAEPGAPRRARGAPVRGRGQRVGSEPGVPRRARGVPALVRGARAPRGDAPGARSLGQRPRTREGRRERVGGGSSRGGGRANRRRDAAGARPVGDAVPGRLRRRRRRRSGPRGGTRRAGRGERRPPHRPFGRGERALRDGVGGGREGGEAARRGGPRRGAGGAAAGAVPGFWYATANAWSVSIRGSYAQFAVRADGGSPVSTADGTAYVREDAPVAFDVDGDGAAERVGRNERVAFEVETAVGVVVPAGPARRGGRGRERRRAGRRGGESRQA